MAITIDGTGNITGLLAGGLPDLSITNADLATDAVSTSKILNGAVTTAKMGSAEQSGLAKAWVNFNGTGTVAIRASYNVSSITDNGTGDYTVNFTTAMADANYSVVCGGRRASGTLLVTNLLPGGTYTASAVQVNSASVTPANIDSDYFNVSVFR
jgi:hypothetical protein